MMRRLFLCGLVMLLSLSFLGCANVVNLGTPPRTDEGGEAAVRDLVESFGSRLQAVSLLASKDIVSKSMEENYGGLVSPALLQKWLDDPTAAPGRLVSSPWPDRIDSLSVEESSKDEYQVKAEIIEVTSVEKQSGGAAAKRPVSLLIKKTEGRWLIVEVTLGDYDKTASTVYQNTQYGFSFTLPTTWDGYSIVTEKWEGYALDSKGAVVDEKAETGSLILLRHPAWTERNRRQDIPIMVFTLNQWESLQKGEFHVGAAPTNPSEFGRNSKYVFALPARYNYAFPEGYEEVENILESKPLQVNETD